MQYKYRRPFRYSRPLATAGEASLASPSADEVFVVGTAAEVTPIRSVDKIAIGGGRRGPITEALQRAFFDVINGKVPDVHGWLTYVYQEEGSLRSADKTVGSGLGARG